MIDRYVLLAGGRNNSGDYLIELRGGQLLARLRPDREQIILNGWEPFSDETLSLVNDSRALILLGGPGLQYEMHGQVYPLCKELDRIKTPIIMMGIGWNSYTGAWNDSRHYRLLENSMTLLRKIDKSGYVSSVRDYHTLNALHHLGIKNCTMTGCPVLYPEGFVGHSLSIPNAVRKVSFSLGVSFVRDNRIEKQTKEILLKLVKRFGEGHVTVVFHHSFDPEKLHQAYGSKVTHFSQAHQRFAAWLDTYAIPKVDISGGSQAMLSHYNSCDLHIGYRVHAHLLRIGMNRPSVLIAEDGRGLGQQCAIGGAIYCAGNVEKVSWKQRLQQRLGRPMQFPSSANINELPDELMHVIENELQTQFVRNRQSIAAKNAIFQDMHHFIESLP